MGENEGGERGFGVCFGNNGGLQWDLGGDWGEWGQGGGIWDRVWGKLGARGSDLGSNGGKQNGGSFWVTFRETEARQRGNGAKRRNWG